MKGSPPFSSSSSAAVTHLVAPTSFQGGVSVPSSPFATKTTTTAASSTSTSTSTAASFLSKQTAYGTGPAGGSSSSAHGTVGTENHDEAGGDWNDTHLAI